MEDKDLLKLANIAIVRQHINHIVNGGSERKNINPIQKVGRELDEEFVRLLLSQPDKVEVLRSVAIESTTFEDVTAKSVPVNFIKTGEDEVLKDPSETRPKIKATKKAPK